MIKSRKYLIVMCLVALSFFIAACVPSSIIQIDIDEFKTDEEARNAFTLTVNALLELNLELSNEDKGKLFETERYISTGFVDPKSPVQQSAQTWFVIAKLLKVDRRVSVLLVQPSANKPSDAMIKRRDELQFELKKMLPQFMKT